ncbi:heparin-binding EGF-like growth factor a isoform X2 [Thalassophryne amazonica]|uniref:heparin-binding EGF-like growth factor a isoform X2 n=1 Tax=Thalassophryne amazonica TaxID=390379 RepID=UPI001471C5B4|nr:heparin-binding EGF-like growth factor a isoform X2 [Thalassophryne amazonica]
MRLFGVALLLLHVLGSEPVRGAAVGRQHHTTVINLMDTNTDRRTEDQRATTVTYSEEDEAEDGAYYYDEDEDEDGFSGDHDLLPRVAMSSKPQDPSAILEAEREEIKRRREKGRKKGKGKGKKRNPCLKKYKDLCIHGTCQYHRELRAPSCVCHTSYSGERCELFTLPVGGQTQEGYSRTTALAVVAVVLSTLCLTIIGLLLMLRYHKRGAYDVESEEKVKLGLASNH